MWRRAIYTAAAFGLGASAGQAQTQVVNIWPGVAPGSERWTHQEMTVKDTPLGTIILNVVTPTLTAYLPDRSRVPATPLPERLRPSNSRAGVAVSLDAAAAGAPTV